MNYAYSTNGINWTKYTPKWSDGTVMDDNSFLSTQIMCKYDNNSLLGLFIDNSKNSIDIPAVKTISLTGQNYYGSFIIDNTMFRALNTLDVSNTGINLTVNNSNCINFNIGRMHSDSVNIINCKLIKSINFGIIISVL